MENEIEELIKQRDLGQSRLEGLLEVVGKDHFSNQWVFALPRVHNFCQ